MLRVRDSGGPTFSQGLAAAPEKAPEDGFYFKETGSLWVGVKLTFSLDKEKIWPYLWRSRRGKMDAYPEEFISCLLRSLD